MTVTDRDALRQQLIAHEGLRTKPYTDTAGKLTIGVGRNLTDRGISDAEARYLLDNDINEAITQLVGAFPWFVDLDAVRQRAFVDLAFMGIGTLTTFTNMLAAAARGEWPVAAAELLRSHYAIEVGQRARDLARMLETGAA